jgi:hypothetical protein
MENVFLGRRPLTSLVAMRLRSEALILTLAMVLTSAMTLLAFSLQTALIIGRVRLMRTPVFVFALAVPRESCVRAVVAWAAIDVAAEVRLSRGHKGLGRQAQVRGREILENDLAVLLLAI